MFSELPPLARGIPLVLADRCLIEGITPACAGNTSAQALEYSPGRNYPRLRGEYLSGALTIWAKKELPPLARGIQLYQFRSPKSLGITPACAGNTIQEARPWCRGWNYPRLRGEYPKTIRAHCSHTELPPLARGIPIVYGLIPILAGITPAYAGNTPGALRGRGRLWNYPRSLGEYLVCIEV